MRRCASCSSAAPISRKGADVLLAAFDEGVRGRDDVLLVIKDLGGQRYYRGMTMRTRLRERAASGALPRVHYVEGRADPGGARALYRACDVLVHPYRGEGFAMPVLEAMACGLPVIVTAGGPTDEFCPTTPAGASSPSAAPAREPRSADLETLARRGCSNPTGALVRALRDAAADPGERGRRGARRAARPREAYSWDAIADAYADRIAALAPARRARDESAVGPLLLPAPAAAACWQRRPRRGNDRLADLLHAWAIAFASAAPGGLSCSPTRRGDGSPELLEAHVLAAAEEGRNQPRRPAPTSPCSTTRCTAATPSACTAPCTATSRSIRLRRTTSAWRGGST